MSTFLFLNLFYWAFFIAALLPHRKMALGIYAILLVIIASDTIIDRSEFSQDGMGVTIITLILYGTIFGLACRVLPLVFRSHPNLKWISRFAIGTGLLYPFLALASTAFAH